MDSGEIEEDLEWRPGKHPADLPLDEPDAHAVCLPRIQGPRAFTLDTRRQGDFHAPLGKRRTSRREIVHLEHELVESRATIGNEARQRRVPVDGRDDLDLGGTDPKKDAVCGRILHVDTGAPDRKFEVLSEGRYRAVEIGSCDADDLQIGDSKHGSVAIAPHGGGSRDLSRPARAGVGARVGSG
jgi:hypothetical protein